MQFPESWLRAFIDPPLASEALADTLTMAGLEVEERRLAAAPFHGVVVGWVKTVERHPNADRLNVCAVDVGDGVERIIVCGAPNVAAGLKVPCALPGAELPGGFRIHPTTMRGVESGGMLCSAKELGISDERQGLLVLDAELPPGLDIRQALELDDPLFILKLTPNRADCLSIHGLAREVAALTQIDWSVPGIEPVPASIPDRLSVELQAPNLCGRFVGRVVRGLNAKALTPDWMRRRLERAGQRSINALVDISNYVMLESGQPSHFFDLDKLQGGLIVRWASAYESLALLNEKTVRLQPDVGVVADATGPVALAGVMGGQRTAVSLDTQNVYIESAFWQPNAITGVARRYNFSSEAAHRFERGVDFSRTAALLERITWLVIDICGGKAGPVDDQTPALPMRPPVRLRLRRAERVIGMPLTIPLVTDVFQRLGFAVERHEVPGDVLFDVTPPGYRFDIAIEEDLIEEIIRLIGYDRLPSRPPLGPVELLPQPEERRSVHDIRSAMAARGYHEVVNYSFVDPAWETDFAANTVPVKLLNPLASQLAVMRSTLWGGLIDSLRYNLAHRIERVRLFETSRVFVRADDSSESAADAAADTAAAVPGFSQPTRLAALAYGACDELQWGQLPKPVDFFDIKGDLEGLLPPLCRFAPAAHPALHPGRSAAILLNGRVRGHIGELHPALQQRYELPLAPVLLEIDLDMLLAKPLPHYRDVSRQPSVIRDLALVVDQEVAAGDILDAFAEGADATQNWVQSVALFDAFKSSEPGKGLAPNEKSLAFRFVFQDVEKTLGDADVDQLMQKLLHTALERFHARLR
ncbi:MAG: phenylalanine--tRNA ligase subunit beta [Burkholderiaceae bacterium]|jgi:phenylalanyl-tRNA synthetase beta chain